MRRALRYRLRAAAAALRLYPPALAQNLLTHILRKGLRGRCRWRDLVYLSPTPVAAAVLMKATAAATGKLLNGIRVGNPVLAHRAGNAKVGRMHRATPVRRHRSPAQRDKIVAAYHRSRLTQQEFASQTGIGCSTLSLWLRNAATAKATDPPAFVPMPNLFPATAATPAYRLLFPQGVIVEVTPGFQAAELATLLQLVQTL